MSLIDIIILAILALFVWKGIKLGLIEAIGGIVGLFIGAFLAGRYYDEVGEMLKGVLFNSDILANVLGFILTFIVVNRAVALIFWIVDKIFNVIAIIPLLKTFNRLLGGIFGLLEGLIFIGIIVFFLSLVPFTGSLQEKVQASRFAGILETVGKIADPLIPDNLPNLQDYLPDFPTLPFELPKNLKDIPLSIPALPNK